MNDSGTTELRPHTEKTWRDLASDVFSNKLVDEALLACASAVAKVTYESPAKHLEPMSAAEKLLPKPTLILPEGMIYERKWTPKTGKSGSGSGQENSVDPSYFTNWLKLNHPGQLMDK